MEDAASSRIPAARQSMHPNAIGSVNVFSSAAVIFTKKWPAAAGSREFIVSRGIAAFLLPDGEQQKKLAGEVELAYSAFKRNILKLNREFNIAMPEEALKIRARIIKTGLPGDSIVKKMWQQRPASGWRDL